MPKTRKPRNKRPCHGNQNKLNAASWYKKCKICGALVVAPNSTGMWLHFKKVHPELNKSVVVPQPQVQSQNSHDKSQITQASTSSGNVAPNFAGMGLHFNKVHPELNKTLVVPQPQVQSQRTQAATSSGNVGRKPQRKNIPRKPRKNLRQPKHNWSLWPKRIYHEIDIKDEYIAPAKIKSTFQNSASQNLSSKKSYFDEDENPYTFDQQTQSKDSQVETKMQTDDDCKEVTSDTDRAQDTPSGTPRTHHLMSQDTSLHEQGSNLAEAASVPLPCDAEESNDDENKEVKIEELGESAVTRQVESTKRTKRPKKSKSENYFNTSGMPIELRDDPKMYKYWKKRHSLFHRFDEGIMLDRESWFSVTPEEVARGIANKYVYDVVLDAFCGAGGNTIQFAHTSKKVIAIDIDPQKISMARHNATVYGVADRIEFIVGDFFELAPTLKADMVFLSPPWGGPGYSVNHKYDLETMLEPKPASELMRVARTISPNITFFLPRNSRPDQIQSLAEEVGLLVKIKKSCLDSSFIAITAYFSSKYIVEPSECDK